MNREKFFLLIFYEIKLTLDSINRRKMLAYLYILRSLSEQMGAKDEERKYFKNHSWCMEHQDSSCNCNWGSIIWCVDELW